MLNIQDDESFTFSADTGEVNIDTPLFDFLHAVMESNLTLTSIQDENPGLNITDNDEDKIPDTGEQLDAVYSYIIENGIHMNETLNRYEGAQIRESFYRKEGSYDATVLKVYTNGIMQEDIKNSEKELKEDVKALDVESISYYHYTGSGIMRNVMIEAIVSSLTVSIFIAQ
jgi:predicted RND superfamily exporter protein